MFVKDISFFDGSLNKKQEIKKCLIIWFLDQRDSNGILSQELINNFFFNNSILTSSFAAAILENAGCESWLLLIAIPTISA